MDLKFNLHNDVILIASIDYIDLINNIDNKTNYKSISIN